MKHLTKFKFFHFPYTKKCLKFLFICLLFGACDDSHISFDKAFIKRPKNLTFILGEQFTCVDEKDTFTIKVSYDKSTKLNYLTDSKNGDTLSSCWVSKFRQLYYFREQFNDTSFWIYAVQIKDHEIKGLQSAWLQMSELQSEVNHGKFKEIIKYHDTTNKITRLTFNKYKLKNFYTKVLDSIPSLKIISVIKNPAAISQTDTITARTSSEVLEQSSSIIKKIYPNPAVDNFNINFEDYGYFNIDIYDFNGRIIKSSQVTSNKVNLNLEDVLSGNYVVRVTQKATNEMANVKLIIQR